ncbi:glycosyltransferase family 4 protein [Roseovarius ramblicola]|uniref:Glycosyltransferase family 4 protein n=1 Tax=Roseovarius ramblicola TaxID=2022336 RepID=A0ABV5HZH4_9RHOB
MAIPDVESASSAKTVMFLSDMCVLDRNSGAALSALSWMHTLTGAGYTCHSVSLSLFDGEAETDMKAEFGLDIDPRDHVGARIRFTLDGIEHNIVSAGTSSATRLAPGMSETFLELAADDLRRVRPDIVFGYGSGLLVPLRKLAGELGSARVFYLANASYGDSPDLLEHVDKIVCPSRALADYYRELHSWDCDVIRDLVPDFSRPETLTPDFIEARRRLGLVTMINPSFAKGGIQFIQIANLCRSRLPDARFLCLESRGTRKSLSQHLNGIETLSNIWWLPEQRDMKPVFNRTAILLVPSLWFEASARVIAEAQLCGIPVIANDVGGTVEQLNGGGLHFSPPETLARDRLALCRPEEVEPWVDAIGNLLGDAGYYHKCSEAAIRAARPFKHEERQAAVRDYFSRVASMNGGAP